MSKWKKEKEKIVSWKCLIFVPFFYFLCFNRSTAKQENSSNHQRSNWSVVSHSSSLLDVTLAHQTLMEPLSNKPTMLNNVKMLWRTLWPKVPKASSKNDHWTLTWPAQLVALLEPSQKKSNHQFARWSQKPVARRRRSWSHFCQSSVWLNWSSLPWLLLLFSESLWSPRKLWSSPSSPSSCRNSCSSRNCCRRVREMVPPSVDFWTLSIASVPTANPLDNKSPTQDTSNTKKSLTDTLTNERKKIFEALAWKKR